MSALPAVSILSFTLRRYRGSIPVGVMILSYYNIIISINIVRLAGGYWSNGRKYGSQLLRRVAIVENAKRSGLCRDSVYSNMIPFALNVWEETTARQS